MANPHQTNEMPQASQQTQSHKKSYGHGMPLTINMPMSPPSF
jgi:hypothetical protein